MPTDKWALLDEATKKTARAIDEWSRAYANLLNELAEHGRFDEVGGELSDEDWADSQ